MKKTLKNTLLFMIIAEVASLIFLFIFWNQIEVIFFIFSTQSFESTFANRAIGALVFGLVFGLTSFVFLILGIVGLVKLKALNKDPEINTLLLMAIIFVFLFSPASLILTIVASFKLKKIPIS